jgi:DNA polymerase III alpha subunit
VFTTACISGEVATYIINNEIELAEQTLIKYRDAFGDKFYV